jgi:RNA polymerase sigma-70 factor (ECF subfamily)
MATRVRRGLHSRIGAGRNTVGSLLFSKIKAAGQGVEPELAALLGQIQQREESALGRFYDLTVGKVYALTLRITGNAADAEEVTCDVYLQLWRDAERYDRHRGNVSQWIMVIARSRALDRYRERRGRERGLHLGEGEDTYQHESAPIAEQLLQQFQVGSIVHAEIAKLSPVQQRLIGLAFFHGFTHQEIAAQTRLPLGTVKSHIARALALLRKALSDLDTYD